MMARKGYTTVALPDTLMVEVDELLEKRVQGYTSRPELIKDAVREKIQKIKTMQ